MSRYVMERMRAGRARSGWRVGATWAAALAALFVTGGAPAPLPRRGRVGL